MFNIRPDNLFPWLRIASPPPDDAPGLSVNPDSAEQDLPGFRLPPEDPDRNMPGFHLQPGGSAGSMPDNAASPASGYGFGGSASSPMTGFGDANRPLLHPTIYPASGLANLVSRNPFQDAFDQLEKIYPGLRLSAAPEQQVAEASPPALGQPPFSPYASWPSAPSSPQSPPAITPFQYDGSNSPSTVAGSFTNVSWPTPQAGPRHLPEKLSAAPDTYRFYSSNHRDTVPEYATRFGTLLPGQEFKVMIPGQKNLSHKGNYFKPIPWEL